MARDRKGKVSSKHSSAGTSSGHGQESEDQGPYYGDGAATPRSHQELSYDPGNYAEPMGEGMSSPPESAGYTASNAEAYSGQGYETQQYYLQGGVQQDQGHEQQEDRRASSSAQPPSSSHSGTNRSHSSRDTSSRHHGRHGQHHNRRQGRESGTAANADEAFFDKLAEQQLAGGTAGFNATYTGEMNQSGNPAYYQGRNAADAFGDVYGAGNSLGNAPTPFFSNAPVPFGNQMLLSNPDVAQSYGNSAFPANQDYRVHPSREFRLGRVLRVMWPELQGHSQRGTGTIIKSEYPNDIFKKERRFVVLVTYSGHSLCAPVLTYGGRACTKHGVHPMHHGIIYSGQQPRLLPNEPQLGYDPVQMLPYETTDALLDESRVNYKKRYTVEHNVGVSFVGEIFQQHMHVILAAASAN